MTEEENEQMFISPRPKYHPKESEEDRELRLSGIIKSSHTKNNNVEKKSCNIIKFDDDIQSNSKLKKIYDLVLK